jgi:hypothetical protein
MSTSDDTDRDHVAGQPLPAISDEVMRERLAQAKAYTSVLLRRTAKFVRPDVDPIIWEHGRRNMALAENGVLAIVLPAGGGESDLSGIGVFAASPEEVAKIMDHDPGVEAGIFSYEVHPVRGFPDAHLP